MHIIRNLAVLGLVMAGGSNLALADDGEPSGPDQLTMPKGKLLVDAFVEMNLSTDAAFEPVSISPDLWYGVTDDLTLGLVHSSLAATGQLGGVGDALCITGESHGCAEVYPGLGIDARYRLKGAWAVDGGLYVGDFDPFVLALKLGIVGRHRMGKLALELAPNLFIGLTERDINKELLTLPVTAGFAVAPKVTLYGQVAFATPFEDAGDLYRFGISVGARFRASDHLDLGLAFSLPVLVGGADGDGADLRSLTLGVSYAL